MRWGPNHSLHSYYVLYLIYFSQRTVLFVNCKKIRLLDLQMEVKAKLKFLIFCYVSKLFFPKYGERKQVSTLFLPSLGQSFLDSMLTLSAGSVTAVMINNIVKTMRHHCLAAASFFFFFNLTTSLATHSIFHKNYVLTLTRHRKDFYAKFISTIPKRCCKGCSKKDIPPSRSVHFSLFSNLPSWGSYVRVALLTDVNYVCFFYLV